MKPVLPLAPATFTPDHRSSWNELVRVLDIFHTQVVTGPGITGYTVSGAIPASATVDLGNINVTAVANTLVKLLSDLNSKGILGVTKK